MDLLIVGSGFFGLTIAERAAASGRKVTVIDRRHHIGGNAYSEDEPETGHRGAPLRRAPVPHVEPDRLGVRQSLHDLHELPHRVYTNHKGVVFPLPINLGTINQFFQAALLARRGAGAHPRTRGGVRRRRDAANLEEKGIALIGRPLYEAFIRDYTAKQWQTDPKDLPAEVISRLPVRYNYDNRYFNDTWEGLPTDGYTAWIERMADHPNIEVKLDDRLLRRVAAAQQGGDRRAAADRLHRARRPLLRLRRGRAVVAHARLRAGGRSHVGDFQGTSRHELRRCRRAVHAHPRVPALPPRARRPLPDRQDGHHAGVLAVRDARRRAVLPGQHRRGPRAACSPTASSPRARRTCSFGGRLGTYQYLDMHMAIGSALSMWNNQLGRRSAPTR